MGKFGTILKAAGVAAMGFSKTLLLAFMSNPITAAIALISAAVLALITDFGGFRTAVNGIGVAIGNAIPPLKGILQFIGDVGNGALDAAASFLGMETNAQRMAKQAAALSQVLRDDLVQSLQQTVQVGAQLENLDVVVTKFENLRTEIDKVSVSTNYLGTTVQNVQQFGNALDTALATVTNRSEETNAAIFALRKTMALVETGAYSTADAKKFLTIALDAVSQSMGKTVQEGAKTIASQEKQATSTTKVQNATLGMSEELASFVAQLSVANVAQKANSSIVDENGKLLTEWIQHMGLAVDTTGGMSESVKAWGKEMLPLAPALKEVGTEIAYVEGKGIDWTQTLKNIGAAQEEVTTLGTQLFNSMKIAVTNVGAEAFPIIEGALERLKKAYPAVFEVAQKLWEDEKTRMMENGQFVEELGELKKKKSKEATTEEEKYAKKLQETAKELEFKAQQLGIYTDIQDLSIASQQVAVKFHEEEKNKLNESRAALQTLALQRGIDTSEIARNSDVLLENIKNNDLSKASIIEVRAATGQLIAERQESIRAADLETKAAQLYFEKMELIPPVLGMTGKGLMQVAQNMDDTANAMGIGADAAGIWRSELDKNQAVEEATINSLLAIAEANEIDIPQSIIDEGIPAIEEHMEAWLGLGEGATKVMDDIKAKVDEGLGFSSSSFDKIGKDAAKAFLDSEKAFEKFLKKTGLSPDNPLVLQGLVDVAVDTVNAEDKFLSFTEVIAGNIEQMKNVTSSTVQSMVSQWTSSISDEFGNNSTMTQAVQNAGDRLIQTFNQIMASGQVKSRAEAFLIAVAQILSPDKAKQMAEHFSIPIPQTVADMLLQGKGPVQQGVTGGITDPMAQSLGSGLPGLEGIMDQNLDELAQSVFGKGAHFESGGQGLAQSTVTGFTSGSHTFATAGQKAWYELIKPSDPARAEAYAKANEIATETQSGYESGTPNLLSAGQQAMVKLLEPYGKAAQDAYIKSLGIADKTKEGLDTIPPKAETALAPVEGIFSQAFLTASQAAGTQLQTLVTAVHTKMSSMSTSVKTYSESMKTNFVAFIDGVKTALPTLDSAIVTTQGAFSNLSTNILTYTTSMGTNIGTFVQNAITAFLNLELAVAANMTNMITTITAFITTTLEQINAYIPIITLLQTTFMNLETAVAGNMTNMITSITAWITTSLKQFDAFIKGGITTLQKSFSDLSKNVATYTTSMTGNIAAFASAATKSFDTAGKAAVGFQGKSSTLSTTVATHMKSMTTNIGTFASTSVSNFNKVGSAADANAKKVAALRKEIDALKSKTITITVNYQVNKPKGMQHGGSFLNLGGPPTHAQHGNSWIQSSPTTIGGTHIAEVAPEIVNVIPLDPKEKSSPFHNLELPMQMPSSIMKSVSQDRGGGGNGGTTTPINVYGEIHITNTLGDGRVITEIIKPFLLKNYSGITSS